MTNFCWYWFGWLLFVVGQAQNSINSPSNGLEGWAGFKRWLGMHWYTLLLRCFFCAIGQAALTHWIFSKINPLLTEHGFLVAAWGIAGISGFFANTLLYQVFGIAGQRIPWLRVDVPQLAPPAPDPSGLPAVNP